MLWGGKFQNIGGGGGGGGGLEDGDKLFAGCNLIGAPPQIRAR